MGALSVADLSGADVLRANGNHCQLGKTEMFFIRKPSLEGGLMGKN